MTGDQKSLAPLTEPAGHPGQPVLFTTTLDILYLLHFEAVLALSGEAMGSTTAATPKHSITVGCPYALCLTLPVQTLSKYLLNSFEC